MRAPILCTNAALAAVLVLAGHAYGSNIFAPGDFIIAIDSIPGSTSSHPGGEPPANALDGNSATKYLNFAKDNSGLIFTPNSGSSAAQSIRFTTANDAEARDPASFSLFGTNDPISSLNNSLGNSENWSLITSSALALPSARLTASDFFDFANAASFSSYRLIFPTLKDSPGTNSMQIADIELFTGLGGAGTSILAGGVSNVLAIDIDPFISDFPAGEPPSAAIDGNLTTKYLNFGRNGSGFIITPATGSSIVGSFEVFTANDAPARDPASYSIFGTNDAITSANNSLGDEEDWTLIGQGAIALPEERNGASSGVIALSNSTAYTSYKVTFDTLKDAIGTNSMQISEVQFYLVPEPSTGLLALVALVPCILRRNRRSA